MTLTPSWMHWQHSMVDFMFFSLVVLYGIAIVTVLYCYRREPLYDPRILFTLAASLWIFILHGYLIDFHGYLAAKPGFYSQDIQLLSLYAISLMLIGYIAFIGGASLGVRLNFGSRSSAFREDRLLMTVCLLLICVAIANFAVNVLLISGGNVFNYLATFALRPYDVQDNKGVSAVGYLLGFIGVQAVAYLVGQRPPSGPRTLMLFTLVVLVLVMRFSQGRVFQTLVLLGACYVCYAMGAASRSGGHAPWVRHFHLLVTAGAIGLGIYFLRIASSLQHLGVVVTWHTVTQFGSNLVHFALERGNVPNFPVVFTILDKIPSEVSFLHGATVFNWAMALIPDSILPADYFIPDLIKTTWYLDIEGGGLPPTAIGEWYANFGFAGVIIGMFLVGAILGVLYRWARDSDSPYRVVLWANLVFGFVVIYPKTDLSQIPVFSIVVLMCLWLLMKILQAGAVLRA